MSDKSEKIGENNFTTNKKGQCRFAKGNQLGQMPKKGVTLKDLTKLIIEYENARGKGKDALLKHYVNRLYENDLLLAKFMDKYIPTTNINELTGPDGQPLDRKIIVLEKVYQDCPLKEKGQCPIRKEVEKAEEVLKK